jgi:hypothetical protein
MNLDPATSVPDWRRIAALWTGLLLAPVAFLANLEVAYAFVTRSCDRGDQLLIHLTHLACLLLALGGTWAAWHVWHAEGRKWPGAAGGVVGRTRFMAGLGLLTGAMFTLVIVAQWIPGFVLSPCQ